MIRLGSWSLCLSLLLAAGAFAQDGTKSSDAKPADALKLEDVSKNLATLQKQAEETAGLLKRMTEQLDKLTDVARETQANTADLKKLRDRLEKLELDVVRLENQAAKPDNSRRSFSLDPAPRLRGTLRLENTYSTPMVVYVDGVGYPLQAGETRLLDRPAGVFSYEVPGVQANVVRSVAAGETFVVRIYPR